jgi:DNA polymerase V
MLALADCNNFYASCERVFQPHLENKAVVVLSNNDGCVIARSNESKKIGVKMGQPAFQLKELIQKNNIHVFSSNFTLYGDISKRVMSTMREEARKMEVYSIDEAFMDFSGEGNPVEKAIALKKKVQQHVGIPISIGIAPTKTLCKVAGLIAKKHTSTGVYMLKDKETIEKALKWLPVEELWGIGRRHAKSLQASGIRSAFDLCQAEDSWIRLKLSVIGLRMVKELRGTPCFALEESTNRKKNICTSRSFGKEVKTIEELRQAISSFANTCAYKLRQQKSSAKRISVFILTNIHKPNAKQYKGLTSIVMDTPTNSSIEIVGQALKGLEQMFRGDCVYKKAGIIVSDIVPQSQQQLSLFDTVDRKKHQLIMSSVDAINKKMGKDKVRLAVQGHSHRWGLKQERLSPCYSTKIEDALKVNI